MNLRWPRISGRFSTQLGLMRQAEAMEATALLWPPRNTGENPPRSFPPWPSPTKSSARNTTSSTYWCTSFDGAGMSNMRTTLSAHTTTASGVTNGLSDLEWCSIILPWVWVTTRDTTVPSAGGHPLIASGKVLALASLKLLILEQGVAMRVVCFNGRRSPKGYTLLRLTSSWLTSMYRLRYPGNGPMQPWSFNRPRNCPTRPRWASPSRTSFRGRPSKEEVMMSASSIFSFTCRIGP